MHSNRLSRARQVAFVGPQSSHDELLFELSPGLVQRNPSVDQLIDDLVQTTVQSLFDGGTLRLALNGQNSTLPVTTDRAESDELGYWNLGYKRSPIRTE